MSARVYAWPRGIAKADPVVAAKAGAAFWRKRAERLRLQADGCDRHAERIEQQIPSAQDDAANAALGSPTRTEGDPDEPA